MRRSENIIMEEIIENNINDDAFLRSEMDSN